MEAKRNTAVKKPRIESEQLNAIYMKWVAPRKPTNGHPYDYHIDRVNFRYGLGKQFEDYVWECGGRIGKENGKRFAEFFEDENLTLFALKHL